VGFLAGTRQLEALSAKLQNDTVVHDFLDHYYALDPLALANLTVIDIKDTLGFLRRIDVDVHSQRRQTAAKGWRQTAQPCYFAAARHR